MSTDEMTVGSAPWRGQEVRVQMRGHGLSTGFVDDMTEDGSIAWILFGGAEPRRMFIDEDAARYTVLPTTSIR